MADDLEPLREFVGSIRGYVMDTTLKSNGATVLRLAVEADDAVTAAGLVQSTMGTLLAFDAYSTSVELPEELAFLEEM